MTEEELRLQKRLADLKQRSEQSGIYTYTGFLTLAEQEVFYGSFPDLDESEYKLWGGFEEAERKALRFGSYEKLCYDEDFPICCIEITPVNKKFADKLSHRDILGAIMNLGIERSLIGDIIVKEDLYFVICLTRISEFISGSLLKIKHTVVKCRVTESMPESVLPKIQVMNPVVNSLRADGIISKVFHISRNENENMFAKGLVFVNGREISKGSSLLKEGDTVSVRGCGKFRFAGTSHVTGKGNYSIKVEKFV